MMKMTFSFFFFFLFAIIGCVAMYFIPMFVDMIKSLIKHRLVVFCFSMDKLILS